MQRAAQKRLSANDKKITASERQFRQSPEAAGRSAESRQPVVFRGRFSIP
jgi:hypothetical protein